MLTINGFTFPTNAEEAKAWQPLTVRIALHRQVLVVARTRIEGTWKAYIFPVGGVNHGLEELAWREDGNELAEQIARAIFPEFNDVPYAR